MRRVPVKRGLLSVSDKANVAPFAARLAAAGVDLVATEGTARALREAGIKARSISDMTGTGELLDGRVKSIHPAVAAGVLADRESGQHLAEVDASGVGSIDLVVVDLYPFEHALDKSEDLIDIGGVTLLRAAAKNHRWVAAVSTKAQYEEVAESIERGGLSDLQRAELAREALFRTASFDSAVLAWMEGDGQLPDRIVLPLRRSEELRYGENPHQTAATYARVGTPEGWWTTARQIRGKVLSFNNYLDADAAWQLVNEFDLPAAVVIKHTNPCGAAVREASRQAFVAAWECDPLAAYGGVVALNRPLEADTAHELDDRFLEVVLAPRIETDAANVLERRKGLRVLEAEPPQPAGADLRALSGGFLAQDPDRSNKADWKVASRRSPTDPELLDLEFAWTVSARTASNAVVLSSKMAAVGVGAGDQSRIGAAERAVSQAGDRARGAVAASDGFIPFRDTVDMLATAGVTALVQPGGSIRDEEVITAADHHGMAMVMSGRRHFRH